MMRFLDMSRIDGDSGHIQKFLQKKPRCLDSPGVLDQDVPMN